MWSILARTLIGPQDHAPDGQRLPLTRLQEEGARRAIGIMTRYGGVIVADSVGMGKTFVALRMVRDALARDWNIIVVVPATLRRKWWAALGSAGAAPQMAPPAGQAPASRVILTSHARVHHLGIARDDRPRLVIVDEAHQFRNPRTARYRALARVTADAHVVLLTATPINNRAADLYWLLRLFLGDGALAGVGVPDLRAALLESDSRDDALMRRAAAAIVVRRTRADWARAGEDNVANVRFPRHHPPRAVAYEPDMDELGLLSSIEQSLPRLRLSAFEVPRRHMHRAPGSTAMLVRFGLLKRAESSTAALRESLLRLLRFLDAFADAVACGGYIRAGDMRERDALQLALTALVARPLPRSADRAALHEDVLHDSELVRQMLAAVPSGVPAKLRALRALLRELDDSRCVVFTEYTETAEALFTALPRAGTALLHGTRAAVASGAASRRSVLEAFAPIASGCASPQLHERIQTLIATDVLAEGLDLQDANHCISYDLPWNPVRLMQRAGRIDRLGSPHSDVYVWYFQPRNEIERWIGLMRRLRGKVETIARAVGAEHGVVGEGDGEGSAAPGAIVAAASEVTPEKRIGARRGAAGAEHDDAVLRMLGALLDRVAPHSPERRQACDVDVTKSANPVRGAVIAIDASVLDDLVGACGQSAAHLPEDRDAMPGTRPVPHVDRLLLVRREAGDGAWVDCLALRTSDAGRPTMLDPPSTLRMTLRLGELLAAGRWSQPDGGVALLPAACETVGAAADVVNRDPAARAVADRIRSVLLRSGGSADPVSLARADRLLQCLEPGVPAATANALATLLRRSGQSDLGLLLDRLETLLPSGRRPRVTVALLICARNG
ncbi:MAG TPA: DEAD/DEAH box helicase [Longimicrobiales bacterium]|nr:DEAD/DEAH box helicase [Longimicrobiales bacterium]